MPAAKKPATPKQDPFWKDYATDLLQYSERIIEHLIQQNIALSERLVQLAAVLPASTSPTYTEELPLPRVGSMPPQSPHSVPDDLSRYPDDINDEIDYSTTNVLPLGGMPLPYNPATDPTKERTTPDE